MQNQQKIDQLLTELETHLNEAYSVAGELKVLTSQYEPEWGIAATIHSYVSRARKLVYKLERRMKC